MVCRFLCFLPSFPETGTFNTGDTWVGTYGCVRQFVNGTKAQDGEQDIKRLTMRIKNVVGNNVTANIDFDWTTGALNGTGQYLASALYDPSGDCQGAEMVPSAWLTNRPPQVPARVLSGRLSDDRQSYYGDIGVNPACNCNGKSPFGSGEGSTCPVAPNGPPNPANGATTPWCYVDASCPDAYPDPNFPTYFIALCGSSYVSCSSFSLSRICSTYRPACPAGWMGYNFRFAFGPALFAHALDATACSLAPSILHLRTSSVCVPTARLFLSFRAARTILSTQHSTTQRFLTSDSLFIS
jgi:hypothetical protein